MITISLNDYISTAGKVGSLGKREEVLRQQIRWESFVDKQFLQNDTTKLLQGLTTRLVLPRVCWPCSCAWKWRIHDRGTISIARQSTVIRWRARYLGSG